MRPDTPERRLDSNHKQGNGLATGTPFASKVTVPRYQPSPVEASMRALRLALPAAFAVLLPAFADIADAQSRVVIESGRNSDVYSRRPDRRVAPRPRVIVVERVVVERRGRARGHTWFRRNGYRPVTVYYADGRYYDRWDNRWNSRRHGRSAMREVVVYYRNGRYYRDWDNRDGRYDGRYDRDGDRYERRNDDRYDRYDRYEDRDRAEYDRWRKERVDNDEGGDKDYWED